MSFAINRRLWNANGYAGRVRFRASIPTSGLGQVSGLSSYGLQHSQSLKLGAWTGLFNFNVYQGLPLNRLNAQGATIVREQGSAFQLNTGLQYQIDARWTVLLEQLGAWTTRTIVNGTPDPNTGGFSVQLAPSTTYWVTQQLALQVGAMLPVVDRGYKDVYPWSVMAGFVADL
jgi:hypothetical protein